MHLQRLGWIFEELMREHQVPQFTVNATTAPSGCSMSSGQLLHELGHHTLTALDLAGIPLDSADRGLHDPIVLAGGHAGFSNPEPIVDFIDCAVIGDGEQAVPGKTTEIIRAGKAERRPGGRGLEALFRLSRTAASTSCVFHRPVPARRPNRPRRRQAPGAPWRVSKHTVIYTLDEWPYPTQAAPCSARRDRPRADVRRDLPW